MQSCQCWLPQSQQTDLCSERLTLLPHTRGSIQGAGPVTSGCLCLSGFAFAPSLSLSMCHAHVNSLMLGRVQVGTRALQSSCVGCSASTGQCTTHVSPRNDQPGSAARMRAVRQVHPCSAAPCSAKQNASRPLGFGSCRTNLKLPSQSSLLLATCLVKVEAKLGGLKEGAAYPPSLVD